MLKTLVIVGGVAILIGTPLVRMTQRFCRRSPGSRFSLAVGALLALVGVVVAFVQLQHVRLPWGMQESPGGLLFYIPVLIALTLVTIGGVAVLIGIALSTRQSTES
jgi:ABC-type Na+ efflux pump permease subunit